MKKMICALRGRNPDNPSERKKSDGRYRQRLEVGGGISNTLTSVEKDNLIIEIEDDEQQQHKTRR